MGGAFKGLFEDRGVGVVMKNWKDILENFLNFIFFDFPCS